MAVARSGGHIWHGRINMKRRNVVTLIGTVALTACLVTGLTACGSALSEAKSIRGEEVTEAEWKAALTEVSNSGAAVSLAASEDETEAEPANFSVSYGAQVGMSLEVTADGETQKASLDMKLDTSFVVADHKMHVTMKYDFSIDGTEDVVNSLKAMLETDDDLSAKGTLEIFYATDGTTTQVIARTDGGEYAAYASVEDITGLSEMVLTQLDSAFEAMDCSPYIDSFADFEYSSEEKGYSLIGGIESDLFLSGDGKFVIKIKDGHLAAIVMDAHAEMDMEMLKLDVDGEAGLVYKVGGQSVDMPEV